MILTNGTFKFREETADRVQFDEEGRPLAFSPSWSDDIKCCVETLTDDRQRVYNDGEFRNVSIKILTETKVPITTDTISVQRFTSAFGDTSEDLGTFRVQSIEYLPHIGAVKILAL